MAWKTPTPRKPPQQPSGKNHDDSKNSGLSSTDSPDTGPKTDYAKAQNDELEVLKSIYGPDFTEHKAANAAWKQKSLTAFDIRIKVEDAIDFAVTLSVVLTATYPKSVPLLSLKDEGPMNESVIFRLHKFIETEPKAVIASGTVGPMIHDLALGLWDILDDAARKKAEGLNLPSLEEERAAYEDELAKKALEQQQEEERKMQDAAKEKERALQEEIIQTERQRQQAKESKRRQKQFNTSLEIATGDGESRVVFDQDTKFTDLAGRVFAFSTVVGKTLLQKGPISTTYRVWPAVSGAQDCHSIALKELEITDSSSKDAAEIKELLEGSEKMLNALKQLPRHRNVMPLLNYRIDPRKESDDSQATGWVARILTPLADKGSLGDLLEFTGHLDVNKVRSWTGDLLSALDFLVSNHIYHQDLHCNNILLFREPTGDVVPKLSDIAFQRQMHAICQKSHAIPSVDSSRPSYWASPEMKEARRLDHRSDVWDLGVVFLQMLFGLDVCEKYKSPAAFIESVPLSSSCHELVTRFFRLDSAKKQTRAFELISSEFLATDAPVVIEESPRALARSQLRGPTPAIPLRLRRESTIRRGHVSRYREDYIEEGRLGKGGFGEVVKARKKLDGQIYAVKKITQGSQATLTEILKEVQLLSKISHPSVVRYYNTWLEKETDLESDSTEEGDSEDDDDDDDESSKKTATGGVNVEFVAPSTTGGLDFMSASEPNIVFGYDTDEGNDAEDNEPEEDEANGDDSEYDSTESGDDDSSSDPVAPVKFRGTQKNFTTVMYIAMEYCEKRTLRDLIRNDLFLKTKEVWRLFRQILEGLAHIHGLNFVHRDLKPDNIFIGLGPDNLDIVKIGDFGLATTDNFIGVKSTSADTDLADQTRDVGTSLYMAPEVRNHAKGSYTTKVDMYSLGIIFFEMCYRALVGMERAEVIGKELGKMGQLPEDFEKGSPIQADIVKSLVTHDPNARPSSSDLLKSKKLPIQMEDETTRRVLASLTTPNSQYYPKVVSALFAAPLEPTKGYAWDMSASFPDPADLLIRGAVKEGLTSIFRRHGALEAPRSSLYPRSPHYPATQTSIVHLLDQDGMVVQLPYDLMLGHARTLARQSQSPSIRRYYTFGHVFRVSENVGEQPQMITEVDFDIVSPGTDLALREAEAIKVLDEIRETFFNSSAPCFHLTHSDLLQAIFDICNVDLDARQSVAEELSTLNSQSMNFDKIRAKLLRAPHIAISTTSIEDLRKFDFQDTPSKAFQELKKRFEGTPYFKKFQSAVAHLKRVLEYAKHLNVRGKIYINPLSSVRANFFTGGIMFQFLQDKKSREVFAAGGRYDSLIEAHRLKVGGQGEAPHAVGFSLALEKLKQRLSNLGGKSPLKKSEEDSQGIHSSKRCDVLVASFDAQILRTTGLGVVSTLWNHDISAELARDSRSPEELLSRNRTESYSWIVIIKHDTLKIKTMDRKEISDVDIPISELVSWFKAALRARGSRHVSHKQSETVGGATSSSDGASVTPNSGQEVRVLVAGTKSKKFNRQTVIEQAQANAAALVEDFLDGPIAAIEASDQVVDLIRGTTLSEPESWRKAEQKADKNEVSYMRDIHKMLSDFRSKWQEKGGSRHAFVYNFRTTKVIYYDLSS